MSFMRRANVLLFVLSVSLFAGCGSTAPQGAQGGFSRSFPQTALRGDMELVSTTEANLNGKPARLAPGARIRNPNNQMQLSGSLIGQRLVVNYTVDSLGQMQDVWVLSDSERAVRLWPRTREESQSWLFDATAQRWTKP